MSLLSAAVETVARVRGDRALHPRGAVVDGVLTRSGLRPPSGVPWVDTAGRQTVLVRFSRAAGLPPPLPDVLGLSVRAAGADGKSYDLLLSSSGAPPGVRHLLVPAVSPLRVVYTSLVPFSTSHGLLVVAALPDRHGGFDLCVAAPTGTWRRFATLAVPAPQGAADRDVAFDPVRNPVPGLDMLPVLDRLRRNSYAASRRGRGRP